MGQGCDPAPRGQRAAGAPLPVQEAASATAEGETCGRSQLVFHRSPLVKEVSINKGDLGLPGNDYAHGCLLGWGHAWAQQGWAACVIRKGLTWLWTTLPPVQRPLPNSRTSPVIREYIRPRDVGERRGGTSDRKGAPSPQEGLESGAGVSVLMYLDDWLLYSPAWEGNGGNGIRYKRAQVLLHPFAAAKVAGDHGHLKHRRLTREVNLAVPIFPRDLQRNITSHLHKLLRPWLRKGALEKLVPWLPPAPTLTVTLDTSDVGWGYESDQGHQVYGRWEDGMRESHINLRELWMAKEWLLRHPHIRNTAIRFDMDNTAAVQCIARQGTARSSALLKLTEEIFARASKRNIHLSARHVFKSLTERYSTLEVDLFASWDTALLPLFLSFSQRTQAGGPDTFTEDWNRWNYIYLFPPPGTKILFRVVQALRGYSGTGGAVPPSAVQTMLKAHRPSSIKQYESCWGRCRKE
ncbi:hypothetical protein O3P69_013038 [Scylla paramamosain]|uniref:Uncharacterized protein n=1 Tax=Scylla paramamosain TaxID=85552 RepID=A0AAW0TR59_SCYPA